MNFRRSLSWLAAFLAFGTAALSAAPAAPTNLKVKALGVNAFLLTWTDNSTDETGWEIRVALKGTQPARFQLLPIPNATSHIVFTPPLAGRDVSFRIASYNGESGKESFSTATPIVNVDVPSSLKQGKPSDFRANVVGESIVKFSWKDNSTLEQGYEMQILEEVLVGTKMKKRWVRAFTFPPRAKSTYKAANITLRPSTEYQFRVRALGNGAPPLPPPSNVVKFKTKAINAPSNMKVTSFGDARFSFDWKDNSNIEAGFELERKQGTGEFQVIGSATPNETTSEPVGGFVPNTDHEFRIRAFILVPNPADPQRPLRVYSDYSNVFPIRSSGLNAPSDMRATSFDDGRFSFDWKDNSNSEAGFELESKEGSGQFQVIGSANQNQTTFAVPGNFAPDTDHEFRVRAFILEPNPAAPLNPLRAYSAYSNTFPIRSTRINAPTDFAATVLGDRSVSLSWRDRSIRENQFLIEYREVGQTTFLTSTRGSSPGPVVLAPLTSVVRAGIQAGRNYEFRVKAVLNGTTVSESTPSAFVQATIPSANPVTTSPFASVNLTVASPSNTVSANSHFSDPDVTIAERFMTNLGPIDIILFADRAITVQNFLAYITDSRYSNSFFHRSVSGFVVQGGGFTNTTGSTVTPVTTFTPIVNEPGISNLRGTVAMAKLGGNPNSATSQFFVNVADNSANLDAQNGGFTVFGRVPSSGMTVVDQINALPRGNYSSVNSALNEMPVNAAAAPTVFDPALLVKVSSVSPAPILTYQVTSANPAIATASVNGSDVTINRVAAESTTITVTATDLDGQSVSQNIPVTVN